MNAKKSALDYARAAFQEAVAGSYPADIIARLYEDLRAEEKKAAKRRAK